MTTNQTIDGVPRELLVRLCNFHAAGWEDIEPEIKELRALLDAPTPTPVPVAWMRFDDDQKAIFTRSKRANKSEPLYAHPTAYRHTSPAAQPQGEPVAYRYRVKPDGKWTATTCKVEFDARVNDSRFEAMPLYAKQPAPVAVKDYQNKINHLKQLLRNVRATLHFTTEDVLAIDAALREDQE